MIQFIIPIKPVTKKNSQQIIPIKTKTGKMRHIIIPSAEYKKFEKECLPYISRVKAEIGVINYPINLECVFYVEKKLKYDLSNLLNAIDDALVHSGLILDDNRDIIAGHDLSRVYHDKYSPRIEIKITEMSDYAQWKNTKDVQTSLF